MLYDNKGTMMSQRYVQWYDIPKAGYEGSDCKSTSATEVKMTTFKCVSMSKKQSIR
jgi:hypothetical protein